MGLRTTGRVPDAGPSPNLKARLGPLDSLWWRTPDTAGTSPASWADLASGLTLGVSDAVAATDVGLLAHRGLGRAAVGLAGFTTAAFLEARELAAATTTRLRQNTIRVAAVVTAQLVSPAGVNTICSQRIIPKGPSFYEDLWQAGGWWSLGVDTNGGGSVLFSCRTFSGRYTTLAPLGIAPYVIVGEVEWSVRLTNPDLPSSLILDGKPHLITLDVSQVSIFGGWYSARITVDNRWSVEARSPSLFSEGGDASWYPTFTPTPTTGYTPTMGVSGAWYDAVTGPSNRGPRTARLGLGAMLGEVGQPATLPYRSGVIESLALGPAAGTDWLRRALRFGGDDLAPPRRRSPLLSLMAGVTFTRFAGTGLALDGLGVSLSPQSLVGAPSSGTTTLPVVLGEFAATAEWAVPEPSSATLSASPDLDGLAAQAAHVGPPGSTIAAPLVDLDLMTLTIMYGTHQPPLASGGSTPGPDGVLLSGPDVSFPVGAATPGQAGGLFTIGMDDMRLVSGTAAHIQAGGTGGSFVPTLDALAHSSAGVHVAPPAVTLVYNDPTLASLVLAVSAAVGTAASTSATLEDLDGAFGALLTEPTDAAFTLTVPGALLDLAALLDAEVVNPAPSLASPTWGSLADATGSASATHTAPPASSAEASALLSGPDFAGVRPLAAPAPPSLALFDPARPTLVALDLDGTGMSINPQASAITLAPTLDALPVTTGAATAGLPADTTSALAATAPALGLAVYGYEVGSDPATLPPATADIPIRYQPERGDGVGQPLVCRLERLDDGAWLDFDGAWFRPGTGSESWSVAPMSLPLGGWPGLHVRNVTSVRVGPGAARTGRYRAWVETASGVVLRRLLIDVIDGRAIDPAMPGVRAVTQDFLLDDLRQVIVDAGLANEEQVDISLDPTPLPVVSGTQMFLVPGTFLADRALMAGGGRLWAQYNGRVDVWVATRDVSDHLRSDRFKITRPATSVEAVLSRVHDLFDQFFPVDGCGHHLTVEPMITAGPPEPVEFRTPGWHGARLGFELAYIEPRG